MIRRILHTAISTPDLDRLARFYCEVLGFTCLSEGDWPVGSGVIDEVIGLNGSSARSVVLGLDGTAVELFEFRSPQPAPQSADRPACDHGYTHLCLGVTDMQAEYARLSAAGMRFHSPPRRMGRVMMAYGRDPDGNIIELFEHLGNEGQPDPIHGA